MKKRIISMLLVIVMVLALVPVQALADGELTITSTKGSAVIGKDQVTLTVTGGTEGDKYEWSAPESVTLAPSADTKACTLEGKTQGTVTVTVKTEDGAKSGKKDFQIYLQPEDLEIIDADTKGTAKEELKVGETLNLGFTCKNLESIQGKSTKWEATDVTGTGVLTVDPKTGALEAKGVGTAKVTLAFNGGRAYQTFTVAAADPGVITVTEKNEKDHVFVGKELELTAMVGVNPANSATFTLDKEGIVEVSKNGNVFTVTGKAPGEVTISFAMAGGEGRKYIGSYKVTVDALKTMEIKADSGAFYAGKQVQLRAFDGEKELTGVVWWCGDSTVATADRNSGMLTCVGAGTAKVKAKLDNYVDAWLPITVEANAFQIQSKVSGKAVNQINVGDEIQLEVVDSAGDSVAVNAWSSNDKNKATVENGLLKGLKKSETNVTIVANVNGTIVKQIISVNNKSFAIQDENGNAVTSISMFAGNTMQLKAVDNGKVLDATWAIDPYKVWATVSPAGLVTATKATPSTPPTIKVTVPGYDDVTLPVTVRDKGSFEKILLDGSGNKNTLVVNEGRRLIALDAENKEVKDVKWSLVNPSEEVELNGDVLTVKTSEINSVSVRAEHSMFKTEDKTFTVKVVEPTEIKVTGYPEDSTLIVGESRKLSITPVPANASFPEKIVWTSEFPAVAEVVNGELQAKKPGTTTLSAKYNDTEIGTFKLTVYATTQIVLDETMPVPAEILAGDELVLKAYLRDTATGKKITANVTWKLDKQSDGDYVRLDKDTLDTKSDLLGVRKIKLIATVDSAKYTAVPLEYNVTVVPKSSAISLWVGGKKVNDKETTLNLNDAAEVADGVTIVATISPDEAGQDVVWNITDDLGIYEASEAKASATAPASLTLRPTSAKRSGTITVKAVAKDGTKVFATTTIHFAKLGSGNLQNAPTALRGGASLDLKPYLVQDKDLDDKSVTWSLIETARDKDNVVVKNGKSMKKGKVIATISKAGKLTTKPVTEPTPITVKITGSNGNPTTHTITLYPATKSIKITCDELNALNNTIEFAKDKDERKFDLEPVIKPGILQDEDVWPLVWSSSDENIAKVSQDGVLTVKDAGKVRIECKTTDGSNVKGYLYLVITKNSADVKITAPAKTLTSGESMNLKAKVLTANNVKASNQSVIWSIADEFGNETKAATIFPTGRVTAGDVDQSTKVVITATSAQDSSVSSTFELTILPNTRKTLHVKADGELVSGTYTMDCGEYSILEGVWLRSNKDATEKAAVDCTFFSSNEGVATVEDGELDAVGYGTATITARCTDPQTGNVFTTTFTVRVMKTVKDITINAPDDRYLRSGESASLSATVWADHANGTEADNRGVTWEVTEGGKQTDAATISTSGVLYAKNVTSVRTVVVKATSNENPSISAQETFYICPAEEVKAIFKLGGVEYSDILPVDLSKGISTLNVTVRTAFEGSGHVITVVEPAAITDLTWASDNDKVVKVESGVLKLVGIGKAKLTASFKVNGKSYSASITALVNQTVGTITIEQPGVLASGKSINMGVKVQNANATNKNVLWYVSDVPGEAVSAEDVVSINRYTGKLSAKRGITDQIKVKVIAVPVDGSASATKTVTIYPLTTKVTIGGGITNTTVVKKQSDAIAPFSATANPSGVCQTFKWTSSNKRVAEVDPETGAVTIKGVGKTVIKATAVDGSGKYARFTLRITK